jgi:hypothetical protein
VGTADPVGASVVLAVILGLGEPVRPMTVDSADPLDTYAADQLDERFLGLAPKLDFDHS